MSQCSIAVTHEWSAQIVTITPDERKWTFMGSHHDRADSYDHIGLATVLSDVVGIILVLFPVNVVPTGLLEGDMHTLQSELDYPV